MQRCKDTTGSGAIFTLIQYIPMVLKCFAIAGNTGLLMVLKRFIVAILKETSLNLVVKILCQKCVD